MLFTERKMGKQDQRIVTGDITKASSPYLLLLQPVRFFSISPEVVTLSMVVIPFQLLTRVNYVDIQKVEAAHSYSNRSNTVMAFVCNFSDSIWEFVMVTW